MEIIVPLIIFAITSILLWIISNSEDKNEFNVILLRNVLPAMVVALLVFITIKYKDHFSQEPMMSGNYFD
jgi:branched-subunit amino acid transport protein AzlD